MRAILFLTHHSGRDGFLVNLMYRAMADWLGDGPASQLWLPKFVSTNSVRSVFCRALRDLGIRVEERWVFLRETTATAHLAILSRACLPGAGRDLGSLDPVNGGYLIRCRWRCNFPFSPLPLLSGSS